MPIAGAKAILFVFLNGIEFTQSKSNDTTNTTANKSQIDATIALKSLNYLELAMPVEWVKQLHQAAIEVDAEQILTLLDRIPQPHADLVNSLTHLLDRYCFEEIISLTQQ